jgi:hypothetical protein
MYVRCTVTFTVTESEVPHKCILPEAEAWLMLNCEQILKATDPIYFRAPKNYNM